jgi:glycosyltransferase involved in cell wall biosynthesis
MTMTYTGQDIAFIIPTKDRPQKIANLLKSFAGQRIMCGRLIIINGGQDIEDVVTEFTRILPIEYHNCQPPGQIRQRNMGLALLDSRTKLVGFLDDDIVLEPKAMGKMIECWNSVGKDTAGIGFNIVNIPQHQHSFLKGLMMSSSPIPGSILSSGVNVPFQNIKSDISTQFLGGGYTIWRREIIEEYHQETLNTRWAWGEDVRYSYPIGKKYPLYVCAAAQVRHEHVYDQAPPAHVHQYQGRQGAIAIFYFASSHSELSRPASLWMLSASAVANFVVGSVTLNPSLLKYATGRIEGIFICLKAILGFTDLRKEMEDF